MIEESRIRRDDPCRCRSGLIFERCCGTIAKFDADGYSYWIRVSRTDANEPEVGTREGSVIVKVQTALNDPSLPALVYDRTRTLRRHVLLEEVNQRMKGRIKAFFYAKLSGGQIVLGDEAPDQAW